MSAIVLTVATLSRLLAPAFKDLYSGAKGQAGAALSKLSTTAGVKKLATHLVKIDKVKTIWSPEGEVSLSKFYFPSKVYVDDAEERIDSELDLPEGNLVIEGIVGQGKSIFMRYLACSLLNSSAIKKVPFLLELRNISAKRNLTQSIYAFLKSVGISGDEETFSYLANSGKIVLLLDGFDEIPEENVSDIIVEIDNLQILYPDLKIIISSRPQYHIQNLVGFKILRLVPLVDLDYDEFVKKLIPSPAKRTDVVDALNSCSDHIKGIISTPLMLTLVIVVYQTEKEIPSSLSEFFDKLFGIVFTKHDKLKAGFNRQHYSGLAERRLRQLFDAFCFMVIQTGGGRSLRPAQFNKAFDGALKLARDCHCEVEGFRNDIVKVACLLMEEGLDLTTFLHKSILDYHAAAFVKDLPDARATTFYQAAANDYIKWLAPLNFLKVIDQVRYAKDYYLNIVATPHKELREALSSSNETDFYNYLIAIDPSITAGAHRGTIVSWGPQDRPKNEIHAAVSSVILRQVVILFGDAGTDRVERLAHHSGAPANAADIVQIPFKNIIEEFGLSPFRSALAKHEMNIFRTTEDYKSIIQNDISQASIFDDILGEPATPLPMVRKKSVSPRKRE